MFRVRVVPQRVPGEGGGEFSMAQWLSFLLAVVTTAWVRFPAFQKFFQRKKMSMLLRLINSAALGKTDSGLKMLIEHI